MIILCAVLALGVISVVMIIVIKGKETDPIQEKMLLAEGYLENLEYEQAIVAYEAVIDIDPKNIDAYFGVAEAYLRQEKIVRR